MTINDSNEPMAKQPSFVYHFNMNGFPFSSASPEIIDLPSQRNSITRNSSRNFDWMLQLTIGDWQGGFVEKIVTKSSLLAIHTRLLNALNTQTG